MTGLEGSRSGRVALSALPSRRWWLVLWALLASGTHTRVAGAHDLNVDHLTLWVAPEANVLEGQLTVAPERTRERAANPNDVVAALRPQVLLHVDGVACRARMSVRELWTRGGAVSGDVVMLSCPLGPRARQLVVGVGTAIPRLAVTVEYRDGQSPSSVSTLLQAGKSSAPLPLARGALAQGWQEGEGTFPAASAAAPPPSPRGATSASRETPSEVPMPPTSPPAPAGTTSTLLSYGRLGIEHIFPAGIDHLLFVVGLVLGATRRRDIAIDVTLFTLAHSLTLALGAAGRVVVSPQIVEPLVTLSIAAVGVENLRAIRPGGAKSSQRRVIAFGFGLLHGQGFAGALIESGIASESFLAALIGFNVGVELAQLGVAVIVATLLPRVQRGDGVSPPVVRVASLVLVGVGAVWTLTRLLSGY